MLRYLDALSRAFLAAIFILSGLSKITAFNQTVAMAAAEGLPAPTVGIAIAAAIEIAGGLALLLGWQVRWATLALFLYLIPTTLIFHASHVGDLAQGRMQMIEVLKNLAIMGGLLKFYADASAEAALRAMRPRETVELRQRQAS